MLQKTEKTDAFEEKTDQREEKKKGEKFRC